MLHVAALTLLAVLNAPTTSDEQIPYDAAYRKAQEEKKPLVVLVGANWCAACRTMKSETIHSMKDAGDFKGVVFTHVDKDTHPEIPWNDMIGMRNRLIHEYFRINLQTVWDTLQNDIPRLVTLVEPLVPPGSD